ncbi:hypothetical protein FDP41_004178 [Naegleria fowleri]|uniref:V-SNARE coiled-coil homology domain-containing protein n=1 Tax=Naegleria fowleri TaxID=5763 RepID=A0A6A5BGA0_NAEFO|nr:uncharacterized protein FDP41_004178 [Naegleria fowleri]KAF0976883.1 hypothetical protein FDP41_004178 [Naegleria fowleri]CAG4719743.1 unnamed protein product [Naegleria fowleri]
MYGSTGGEGNDGEGPLGNGIIYSLVSRGTTILCEYTENKGNFQQISRQILEKIPSNKSQKASYLYDQYIFHILVHGENGLIFFCMSSKEFGSRIPFNFLEDIKERFLTQYPGDQSKRIQPNGLNREFGQVLKQQTKFFNNPKQNDRIQKVKGQIEEVKDIMIDNIDKVLDRGEKIDLLVNRTGDLVDSAELYKRKSKKLKNNMLYRNIIIVAVIVIIVLIVLFLIIWFACGFPAFDRCRSK